MRFTVKEMEVLCVYHAGTISATLALLREATEGKTEPRTRLGDIENAVKKLSGMKDGDIAYITFEPEK